LTVVAPNANELPDTGTQVAGFGPPSTLSVQVTL
jgi:hypothetical protein